MALKKVYLKTIPTTSLGLVRLSYISSNSFHNCISGLNISISRVHRISSTFPILAVLTAEEHLLHTPPIPTHSFEIPHHQHLKYDQEKESCILETI